MKRLHVLKIKFTFEPLDPRKTELQASTRRWSEVGIVDLKWNELIRNKERTDVTMNGGNVVNSKQQEFKHFNRAVCSSLDDDGDGVDGSDNDDDDDDNDDDCCHTMSLLRQSLSTHTRMSGYIANNHKKHDIHTNIHPTNEACLEKHDVATVIFS